MSIKVIDPVSRPAQSMASPPTVLKDIRGQRVAILNNKWESMDIFAAELRSAFTQRHGAVEVEDIEVSVSKAAPAATLERVARESALAVVGLAN